MPTVFLKQFSQFTRFFGSRFCGNFAAFKSLISSKLELKRSNKGYFWNQRGEYTQKQLQTRSANNTDC